MNPTRIDWHSLFASVFARTAPPMVRLLPSETPLFDATVLATGIDPSPWWAEPEDGPHLDALLSDLSDYSSVLTAEVSR